MNRLQTLFLVLTLTLNVFSKVADSQCQVINLQKRQLTKDPKIKNIIDNLPTKEVSHPFFKKTYSNFLQSHDNLLLVTGGARRIEQAREILEIVEKTNKYNAQKFGRQFLPKVNEIRCLQHETTKSQVLLVSNSLAPSSSAQPRILSLDFFSRLRSYSKFFKDYFTLASYNGQFCNLTWAKVSIAQEQLSLPDLAQIETAFAFCTFPESSFSVQSSDDLLSLDLSTRRIRLDMLFLSLFVLESEIIHRQRLNNAEFFDAFAAADVLRNHPVPGIDRLASLRGRASLPLLSFANLLRAELAFISDMRGFQWDLEGLIESISEAFRFMVERVSLAEFSASGLFGEFVDLMDDLIRDESSLESPSPKLDELADKIDLLLSRQISKMNLFIVQEN